MSGFPKFRVQFRVKRKLLVSVLACDNDYSSPYTLTFIDKITLLRQVLKENIPLCSILLGFFAFLNTNSNILNDFIKQNIKQLLIV